MDKENHNNYLYNSFEQPDIEKNDPDMNFNDFSDKLRNNNTGGKNSTPKIEEKDKTFSFVDYLAIFSMGCLLFCSMYAVIYIFSNFEAEDYLPVIFELGFWISYSISSILSERIMPSIVSLILALILILSAIYFHTKRNIPFNRKLKVSSIVVWIIFYLCYQFS